MTLTLTLDVNAHWRWGADVQGFVAPAQGGP